VCNKKINEKPYKDEYGRITFFKLKLGPHIVPIYQPGTPMFESAVKKDSKLAVHHNNA